jgi:hypothetical protein
LAWMNDKNAKVLYRLVPCFQGASAGGMMMGRMMMMMMMMMHDDA